MVSTAIRVGGRHHLPAAPELAGDGVQQVAPGAAPPQLGVGVAVQGGVALGRQVGPRQVDERDIGFDLEAGAQGLPLRRIDAEWVVGAAPLAALGDHPAVDRDRRRVVEGQLVDALVEVRRSLDQHRVRPQLAHRRGRQARPGRAVVADREVDQAVDLGVAGGLRAIAHPLILLSAEEGFAGRRNLCRGSGDNWRRGQLAG